MEVVLKNSLLQIEFSEEDVKDLCTLIDARSFKTIPILETKKMYELCPPVTKTARQRILKQRENLAFREHDSLTEKKTVENQSDARKNEISASNRGGYRSPDVSKRTIGLTSQ